MRYIFNTLLFSLSIFSANAQVEEKNIQKTNLSSRQTEETKPSAATVIIQKPRFAKPQRVPLKENANSKVFAVPTMATRSNEPIIKNDISINVDLKKTDLDNLLTLLEEKENIHKYNSDLTKSTSYKELLSQISFYKTKFNQSVKDRGIENCSTKEQNYFLSFLKEEGKEDEYKSSIAKIK